MLIFLESAEKVPYKNVSRIAKEGEKIFLDTLIHLFSSKFAKAGVPRCKRISRGNFAQAN